MSRRHSSGLEKVALVEKLVESELSGGARQKAGLAPVSVEAWPLIRLLAALALLTVALAGCAGPVGRSAALTPVGPTAGVTVVAKVESPAPASPKPAVTDVSSPQPTVLPSPTSLPTATAVPKATGLPSPITALPPSPTILPPSATQPTAVPMRLSGTILVKRGDAYVSVDLATNVLKSLFSGADELSWSNDGKFAAFSRNDGHDREVYIANRDGSGEKAITNNQIDDIQPALSPDGRYVALVRSPVYENRGFEGNRPTGGEIWIVDLTTMEEARAGNGFRPAWSPDSRRLAFATNVGPDGNGIALVNTRGENLWLPVTTKSKSKKYTPFEWDMTAAQWLTEPAWAPDGIEITFRVVAFHGVYLATQSYKGGIAGFWGLSFDNPAGWFSYSPDGSKVTVGFGGLSGYETVSVYPRGAVGPDGFNRDRMLLQLGRIPRTSSEQGESVTGFAWSPDSSYLVYVAINPDAGRDSSRSGNSSVWVRRLSDNMAMKLADNANGPVYWLP